MNGADGQAVNTLNSANFAAPGGLGGAGGGTGGRGSPNSTFRSARGEDGFAPFGMPNVGGRGGRLACMQAVFRGSAGGGGAFATAGDPFYLTLAGAGTSFQQQLGIGGQGGGGPLGIANAVAAGRQRRYQPLHRQPCGQ